MVPFETPAQEAMLAVAEEAWKRAAEVWRDVCEMIRPIWDALADAFKMLADSLRRAGLLAPDPAGLPRGARWESPLGDKFRLVVDQRRGPRWKPVGPTRERWWK
jgi:hypothetical protein